MFVFGGKKLSSVDVNRVNELVAEKNFLFDFEHVPRALLDGVPFVQIVPIWLVPSLVPYISFLVIKFMGVVEVETLNVDSEPLVISGRLNVPLWRLVLIRMTEVPGILRVVDFDLVLMIQRIRNTQIVFLNHGSKSSPRKVLIGLLW